MNTNKSNAKKTVICSWCSYDANPVGATYCQKCGKPLAITSQGTKERIAKSTLLIGGLNLLAIALLLFGLGSYFLWQQDQVVNTSSTLKNFPDNSSSDIRLYNSMKEVPNVPEGIFNYGGAFVFSTITAQGTHKAINQVRPNFQLRFTEPVNGTPGSSAGVAMLINKELSLTLAIHPLEDADYKKAQERGFTLEQVPIAIDGASCFTHPDISIPGLSVDQVKDIYKGKITNWKDVGGPNLPIVLFRTKSGATLKMLLGSEKDVTYSTNIVRDFTDIVRKVSSTRGAIATGTASLVVGQQKIRPIALARNNTKNYVPIVTTDGQLNAAALREGTYPLSRRMFIVFRRDNTPEETAGVAYVNFLLSKEGQQFIEKAGFVPVR